MATGSTQAMDSYMLLLFMFFLLMVFSCIFSLLSGWHSLGERFRSTMRSTGKCYFASIDMGQEGVTVRCGAFVRFDSVGISLSVFPLFRFLHPRLFIPWTAIKKCKRERIFFAEYTVVYISKSSIRILFHGRLGRELYAFRNG